MRVKSGFAGRRRKWLDSVKLTEILIAHRVRLGRGFHAAAPVPLAQLVADVAGETLGRRPPGDEDHSRSCWTSLRFDGEYAYVVLEMFYADSS
jgi:hypothetical protein